MTSEGAEVVHVRAGLARMGGSHVRVSGRVTFEVALGAFLLVALAIISALKAPEATPPDPGFQDDPIFRMASDRQIEEQ